MTYSFRPHGVCSQEMRVDLDEQGRIANLEVLGGCSGNLKGISALVRGMSAREAVERLKGIRCGAKSTSCPDQLARAWNRSWHSRSSKEGPGSGLFFAAPQQFFTENKRNTHPNSGFPMDKPIGTC